MFIIGISVPQGEAGDGLKAPRPESKIFQGGQAVNSRAKSEKFPELVLLIDVSAFIKNGRINKGFTESECYSKILETAFNQVQWSAVQSEDLRKKIWRFFIRATEIEYIVEGFHLGPLKKVGRRYQIECKYKSVSINQGLVESHILSVLGVGER
jgi:hypothetical protein